MNQPVVVRGVVAALASLALSLSGCASISNVQTADTLGKGNIQAGIEPGVWGVASGSGTAIVPHVDAAVRYGVADSVDIGVRAGSSFLELQGKFLFTRAGDPNIAVSLAPTLGGFIVAGGGAGGGVLNIGVPVLIGIKTSGGSEFVIGPRVQTLVILGASSSGSATAALFGVGGSLGFAWRISDNFGLMPEFAAVYPVAGGAAASGIGSAFQGLNAGGAFIQFKLGILIGRFRKVAHNDDIQQGPPPPPPPPPAFQPAGEPPPPPPPPPPT